MQRRPWLPILLLISACFPEHAVVVPGIRILVLDANRKPIPDAAVLVATKQYPYTELSAKFRKQTDAAGIVELTGQTRWVTQILLVPHGMIFHNIDVCIAARGHELFFERFETDEFKEGQTVELKLESGESTDRCWVDQQLGGIRRGTPPPGQRTGIEVLEM